MRRTVIGVFTGVVLLIVFIALCTFVRRPYEIVLLYRFGNIIVCSDGPNNQHSPILYNWYLKLPTDEVIRIDTRLHLEQTALQQAVTAGSVPLSYQAFVAWRIVDPDKFYKTMAANDDQCRAIIARKINSLVQAKLASHTLDELFNQDESKIHMASMELEIAKEATVGTLVPVHPGPGMGGAGGAATHPAVKGSAAATDPAAAEWMPGVQEEGVQIVEVGFSRMAFPPNNAASVYERMSAERDKLAQDSETKGLAEKESLTQAGIADAAKITAKAKEQAGQIEGDADREANQALASVQQSESARKFYEYWKSLDFVKGSFTKNTYIVLPTDSDWLRALFSAPQNLDLLPRSILPAATMPRATGEPAPPLPAVEQPGRLIDPTKK